MKDLFTDKPTFNDDISEWNVSNVTDMSYMFGSSDMGDFFGPPPAFNQDIGDWNVSNVTNMSAMFYGASAFNQDIGGWNVSNVTTMLTMFSGASTFNQDIGGWDVSSVTQCTECSLKSMRLSRTSVGGASVTSHLNQMVLAMNKARIQIGGRVLFLLSWESPLWKWQTAATQPTRRSR